MVTEAKIRQLGQDIYDEIGRVTKQDAVGPEQTAAKEARLEELNIAMRWNAHALRMAS